MTPQRVNKMRPTSFFRLIWLLSAVGPVLLLLQLPVSAQNQRNSTAPKSSIPRRPDGRPDLQGIWTNFDSTPLEARSAEDTERLAPLEETFPGISKPDRKIEGPNPSAEFIDLNVKRSPNRRSLIVDPADGRAPVRAEALKIRANNLAHLTDSWEFQTPWERCITRGAPGGMLPAGYNNGYQIFQTSDYIAIVYEMLHEPRIIPLDGRPHVDNSIRLWNGDSRGHWEGDALVVDVTNYRAANSGTIATGISTTATLKSIPQSEAMHVTERFTRIDADTIKYEVTVEDPEVYTRPWTVSLPLNRSDDYRVLEYACHEGNYGLPNSLSGARAQEKKKATRKSGGGP
jgi:hypothetical protein